MTKQRARIQVSITAAAGKAQIRITSDIQEYSYRASANSIRQQVDEMLEQGITDAEVYINSRGGDAFEATEMANELGRFANVQVRVGALAASAGTYFLTVFNSTAKPSSQLMIHKPSMYTSGTVEQIEADLKMARNTTDLYRKAYAGKTGMTEAQVDELWGKGDYWMTAEEALRLKFIDAIDAEDLEPTPEDEALLEACAAPVKLKAAAATQPPTTPPSPKPNSNKMDKAKIILALGLDADATEEQIEAALKANKTAAEAHAQMQANARNKGAQLVATAVADKRIDATQAATYEKLAEANYEATAEVLAAMTSKPKLSAALAGTGKAAGEDGPQIEARKDWTLDDWMDKDPQGLAELKESNPTVCASLEKAYFSASRK